jgi:hypothetical protein
VSRGHVREGFIGNLFSELPILLLGNAEEKSTVVQGKEVRVVVLLHGLKVRVDLSHWLDNEFAVVRSIEKAEERIPHLFS